MQITPLSAMIGASITDIDLSKPLDEHQLAAINQAFLDYQVIIFRGQQLTPAEQRGFACQLGEPDIYPLLKGLDGFPEITPVLKKEDETVNFGGVWHTDTSYQPCPPKATMLYALELPPVGGDTLFSSQYAAHDALSEGLRQMLTQMRAIAIAGKGAVAATRQKRIDEFGADTDGESLRACHPVVRTHPETGRKALYINKAHTLCFEGWTEAESEALLEMLYAHQIREEFQCRLRWGPGDLAIWDNRCVLHYPVNDYHGHRRLLHRITLKGDIPV